MPASSVISSTLLAMVSSVSRRPAVPCPFSRREVMVSMLCRVLSRLSTVVWSLASEPRTADAGRLDLALARSDQRLDRLGDVADVLDRHLGVAGLGRRHVVDVGRDVIDAVEQALEHDRVGLDQLVDVGGDVGELARGQLVNVLQDVFQDGQDRADVGHEIRPCRSARGRSLIWSPFLSCVCGSFSPLGSSLTGVPGSISR